MNQTYINGYKFYDKNKNLLDIQACYNCKVCKDWRKKGSTWKFFEFCPIHCFNCHHAGYDDEFDFIFSDEHNTSGIFVCIKCKEKYEKRI